MPSTAGSEREGRRRSGGRGGPCTHGAGAQGVPRCRRMEPGPEWTGWGTRGALSSDSPHTCPTGNRVPASRCGSSRPLPVADTELTLRGGGQQAPAVNGLSGALGWPHCPQCSRLRDGWHREGAAFAGCGQAEGPEEGSDSSSGARGGPEGTGGLLLRAESWPVAMGTRRGPRVSACGTLPSAVEMPRCLAQQGRFQAHRGRPVRWAPGGRPGGRSAWVAAA